MELLEEARKDNTKDIPQMGTEAVDSQHVGGNSDPMDTDSECEEFA